MVKLNNWSHGLYYYIAACCHVEQYRELLGVNTNLAETHAERADELFAIIPQHLGRKKLLARALPFDVFVNRKLSKWQSRAKAHNLRLADAVGVSPITEVGYFWNVNKRMKPQELEMTLRKLDWSGTSPHNKIRWATDSLDEHALYGLLRGTCLRHLGRTEEARDIFTSHILQHDKLEFKGGFKENWTPPVAHYEVGCTYWVDYQNTGDKEYLVEAQKFLDAAKSWDSSYDLEAR